MGKHQPTTVWGFWREPKSTGLWRNGHVRTVDEGNLEVALFPQPDRRLIDEIPAPGEGIGLRLTRTEARMLARRIDQCLNETVSTR